MNTKNYEYENQHISNKSNSGFYRNVNIKKIVNEKKTSKWQCKNNTTNDFIQFHVKMRNNIATTS